MSIREIGISDFESSHPGDLKDKTCTAVMFFAPWCGHCQALKPQWKTLQDMRGFMKVVAFDCDVNQDFVAKIGKRYPGLITGYPTILFYKNGKPVKKYTGERTAQNILKSCMDICSKS